MAKLEISTKRVAISKANAQVVGIVAAAAFVTVFCLIASKAIFSQIQYQSRVTNVKEKAHRQLQQNLKSYDDLHASYLKFDAANPNVIGRNSAGTGDSEGANSKIILDALPSSYDFPALTSSLEKVLKDNGLQVSSITGTDDQIAQQANATSPTPQPVPIPFSFTVNHASYDAVNKLIIIMEQSIRPFQIDRLTLSGGTSNMTLSIDAHSYYQPGKSVDIKKQVVK